MTVAVQHSLLLHNEFYKLSYGNKIPYARDISYISHFTALFQCCKVLNEAPRSLTFSLQSALK